MKDLILIVRSEIISTIIEEQQAKIALVLGQKDVAVVKKITIDGTLTANTHGVSIGLYRKSEDVNSDITSVREVSEDNNWVLWEVFDTGDAAYTGKFGFHSELNFDDGELILIRPPQFVMNNTEAITAAAILTIYYVIKTVSDKAMAALMMLYKGK